MDKIVKSLKEVFKLCGLKDGMTLSFHHHLRNGDYVLNMVTEAAAQEGYKDLKIAMSSLFPVHQDLIKHIKNKTVTSIDTNYMSGPLGEFISCGGLDKPVTFRSHGGRPKAIADGELKIDIAFIAAPSSDRMGNINGVKGPSRCGSLGYVFPDAEYAEKTVVITDNLVDYPNSPVSIDESHIDYIVKVDSIGDPSKIVSGTTQITRDPVGLKIADNAAKVIAASGILKEGFSFQTGAGGASLAAAAYLRDIMLKREIKGSFCLGGITKYFVDFLNEGLFKKILDVQCFDLDAVESIGNNPDHIEISSSHYANPSSKSCVVNSLDTVILGATEIDTDFNVNVHTDSNGLIIGGSGGHCDAASGSSLSIIVAPIQRGRLPIIVDKVTTMTTPGKTVDVVVTERGIAVNPLKPELAENLKKSGLNILPIKELQKKALEITGTPRVKERKRGKVVAEVIYRDSSKIDEIYQIS